MTDLEASTAWYQRIFDIAPVMEEAHDGGWQRLLADSSMQLIIVLHRHDVNQGETFSERRTGLDHVGMAVPSRDWTMARSDLQERLKQALDTNNNFAPSPD